MENKQKELEKSSTFEDRMSSNVNYKIVKKGKPEKSEDDNKTKED